jgi:BlaI family transcriptional regulator, penicillinase repressor
MDFIVVVMKQPRFTPLELQVMEALWTNGPSSVREIHEAFPEQGRPAFTTVQTTIYRLEAKKALHCVKRISNANIFEAVVSRADAERRLLDDVVAFFGGKTHRVMAHLAESGRLTLEDIEQAEQALRDARRRKGRSK